MRISDWSSDVCSSDLTLAMDILVDMPKVAGHVHPQAPLDRKIVPAGSLSVVEAVFQMLTDRSTRGAIGLNNGIHDVGVNLTRNLISRNGHMIEARKSVV